ncbi:MAG: hypothetical protein U1F43_16630 [Myxococcota bacterium]
MAALGAPSELGPIALDAIPAAGLRDKLDLQLRDGVVGLGALDDPKTLVDMPTCPLAAPALDALLAAFRADRPPVARASVRLRVDMDGARGLWLDLAHADLKVLLDERAWLARWAPTCEVELGPKARRVRLEGGLPGLEPAHLRPWSSTWSDASPTARELPLLSRVADFSQPSRRANRALVAAVLAEVAPTGADRWLELGAGAGNLTLPLAFDRRRVRAVELEPSALRLNLAAAAQAAVVEVVAGSFARAADVAPLVHGVDAILADPPRSGLGPFATALSGLAPSLRPRDLVYVSCHVDALAKDTTALAAAGYQPVSVRGVDQFPHTPHVEWVVRFSRG